MSVKTYDPNGLLIIFNGHILEGFADGTFVEVARKNPMWSTTVGAGGEGARAKSNDKSGNIKFTLMQTSKSNDALSAMAKLDELSNDGVGPFLIRDSNGTTLCECSTAYLLKPADVAFSKEIESREWELETDAIEMLVGGVDLA